MGIAANLLIRAGADFTDLDKKMKASQKKVENFGKGMQKMGDSFTKTITAPVIGAGAALGALAINAGKMADDLITMSNKTGVGVEQLQELEYAARFVDVEVETMTDSQVKLTRAMNNARKGSKAQSEAFEKLGISVTNSDGSLRDAKEVWYESIDALGKMENETERNALSMEIFGKSAQELNPLIKAGSEELKKLADRSRELGIIMSEADVMALGRFDDSMQDLQATILGTKNKLAVALLPALEALIPIIIEQIIPAAQEFGEKLSKLIQWFAGLKPETQETMLKFVALSAALGPVISGVGGLIIKLAPLITKLGVGKVATAGMATSNVALGTSFLALAGPILGVVTVLGMLAIAYKDAIPYAKQLANEGTLAGQALAAGSKNGFVRNSYNAPAIKNTTSATAAFDAKMAAKSGKLESYAIGTNYVPSDGLAYLHRGEAVIPADQNKGFNSGGIVININGNVTSEREADIMGNRIVRQLKLAGVKV